MARFPKARAARFWTVSRATFLFRISTVIQGQMLFIKSSGVYAEQNSTSHWEQIKFALT